MPGRSHRRHIVEHVAFRLLNRAEIRNDLLRLHDYLTEQQNTRADDLTDHTHHAHNRMHLLKIPAGRTEFLPYIWHCINPDDVDSLICKEEEIVHHLIEHTRVAVIQIPLIRIEGGHDKMSGIRKPGKVARCCRRKYLRNGLFIFCRNIPVVKEEITGHIFTVSLTRTLRPLVIL